MKSNKLPIYTKNLMHRKCIICGSEDFAFISNKMKYGPQLRTIICKKCSLVFSNPVPSENSYDSFYINDYSKYYGKTTASIPNMQSEPQWIEDISKMVNIVTSSYLEIGPGRGNSLFHADRRFNSATGLEVSREFSKYLRDSLLLNVESTSIVDYSFLNEGKYDVVGMFHVLEHIYNPVKCLEAIHKVLKNDGILVIEVPNILKPFKDFDRYFLRYVHLFNFSPLTLKYLLNSCGFKLVIIDDAGDDWAVPQNIYAIFKKVTKKGPFIPNYCDNNYLNVLKCIDEYRYKFNSVLRYQWYIYTAWRPMCRNSIRLKWKIKQLIFK